MDLNLSDTVEKPKRRSKADSSTRNYICGCGKAYLSYAALYTHLKTKHDGSDPSLTILQSLSSQKKRGRPKKFTASALDNNRHLIDLQMLGGFTDAKSELVDSPLYTKILEWDASSTSQPLPPIKCDDAFALYLLDTSKLVDPHSFNQIVKFIESFRKSLQNQCEDTQGLPEKFEFYIQYYIPANLPSFDRKIAMKLALHFSQWLLRKELTNLQLGLKE